MWVATATSPLIEPMEDPATPAHDPETALDHELMNRCAAGDHEAFRRLVERHRNAVIGTVAKMLGNSHDAEDISQQVFLRVWRNARHYRPDAKFTTYLFTITRNLVFNETRRRSRKKEISSDQREDEFHQSIEDDPSRRPDSEMLHAELQQAVDRAIAALPDAQRLAVVLRRYEQVPYEEIAEVLKITVPAVKSLLFRARSALRINLAKYLDDGSESGD